MYTQGKRGGRVPSLASTPGMEYTCVRQAVVPNRQAYIHQESGDGGTDVVVPALQLLQHS